MAILAAQPIAERFPDGFLRQGLLFRDNGAYYSIASIEFHPLTVTEALPMDSNERKLLLRKRISEAITQAMSEPHFLGMHSAEVSEALVECAVASRDCKGGIDDTCYAALKLHKVIDNAAAKNNPEYTPEKLADYAKKRRHIA